MPKPKTNRKGKTIAFEIPVLEELERYCKKVNTTPSNFVNAIIKKYVIAELDFWREVARQRNKEFQEALFMVEQLTKEKKECE